jgi:drug/metabolite transporter (DMT)-like permease
MTTNKEPFMKIGILSVTLIVLGIVFVATGIFTSNTSLIFLGIGFLAGSLVTNKDSLQETDPLMFSRKVRPEVLSTEKVEPKQDNKD